MRGEVRFMTTARSLVIEDGVAKGVRTDTGEIRADGVVLATGHSAHDVFRSLHASDVPLEAKGIAMGVRLEHPQHPHRLHPVSFGEGGEAGICRRPNTAS